MKNEDSSWYRYQLSLHQLSKTRGQGNYLLVTLGVLVRSPHLPQRAMEAYYNAWVVSGQCSSLAKLHGPCTASSWLALHFAKKGSDALCVWFLSLSLLQSEREIAHGLPHHRLAGTELQSF